MEMIDGVKAKKLRLIPDERGWLMEILRSDDGEFYERFGQVYVTVCYPGVVKAWHYHRRQTDNFCAIRGMAKVVLFDRREGSPTRGRLNEFHMGELNPLLIRIPPLVLHGFTAEGPEPAMVINVPTEVYDHAAPDEHRIPHDSPEVPYDWRVRHG